MRILFLNQYFPPDPAPTGILLRELADDLAARGHEVDFVDAAAGYRATQKPRGRMIREAKALLRMLVAGARKPRPDVVLAGSSPPVISFIAGLVAAWHRAAAVHWIMDLYPEIAVALGEIRESTLSRNGGFSEVLRTFRAASLRMRKLPAVHGPVPCGQPTALTT